MHLAAKGKRIVPEASAKKVCELYIRVMVRGISRLERERENII